MAILISTEEHRFKLEETTFLKMHLLKFSLKRSTFIHILEFNLLILTDKSKTELMEVV